MFDTGGMRSAAHLELVRDSIVTAATLAHERTLPVAEALTSLVPSGVMQRGSTLAFHGVGATSLALAMAGQAVRDGSFLAIVAPESFGLAACLDFDIPLRRVVQFTLPAGAEKQKWAQVVAAIVEGFDVVLLADRQQVGASHARQLVARNRERGSVLLRAGGPAWPDAADLRFDLSAPEWSGLGGGHGYLQARQVDVKVAGRRYHGTRDSQRLLLPAIGEVLAPGGVALAPVSPIVPVSPIAPVPPIVPVTPVANERFAGADIDDMLDVVEGLGAADGADRGDDGGVSDPDLNAPDLNAPDLNAPDLNAPDLNATA